MFWKAYPFSFDTNTLHNCAVLCLINVSSLQMLVPSAAFEVGNFTILGVGSVIAETKKEPSFLCARQEEPYSASGRSCKEHFQSSHSNPSPSQHSSIYIYRANSLSDLSGSLELRFELTLWNKQPRVTAPVVRPHLYSLALLQIAINEKLF